VISVKAKIEQELPEQFLGKTNAFEFMRPDETHTSLIKELIKAD